jgi:hypothetical protein
MPGPSKRCSLSCAAAFTCPEHCCNDAGGVLLVALCTLLVPVPLSFLPRIYTTCLPLQSAPSGTLEFMMMRLSCCCCSVRPPGLCSVRKPSRVMYFSPTRVVTVLPAMLPSCCCQHACSNRRRYGCWSQSSAKHCEIHGRRTHTIIAARGSLSAVRSMARRSSLAISVSASAGVQGGSLCLGRLRRPLPVLSLSWSAAPITHATSLVSLHVRVQSGALCAPAYVTSSCTPSQYKLSLLLLAMPLHPARLVACTHP